MSEMSPGAKAAWERELKQRWPHYVDWAALPPVIDMHRKMFAAGVEATLAAIEREAAKLDKASSDESLSRESRILFISQASALRMAIWSIKKGQEANKR